MFVGGGSIQIIEMQIALVLIVTDCRRSVLILGLLNVVNILPVITTVPAREGRADVGRPGIKCCQNHVPRQPL